MLICVCNLFMLRFASIQVRRTAAETEFFFLLLLYIVCKKLIQSSDSHRVDIYNARWCLKLWCFVDLLRHLFSLEV